MKTQLFTLAFLTAATAWCAKPAVIPEIRDWADIPDTAAYTLTDATRVVVPEDACPALVQYAKTFAADINRPFVQEKSGWLFGEKAKDGDIVLRVLADAEANPESYQLTAMTFPRECSRIHEGNPESYRLTATDKGITILAPAPIGAFWGTRTILQVFNGQNNTFPAGVAEDAPAYKVRGFMFDCGRKPFTLTTLRQIVDICSYYKLNDLQLHLTDNYIWLHNYPGVKTPQDVLNLKPGADGFRLESDVKGLTSTDLFYTKAEFRQLVEEAAGKGVNIIPEIDVPGHALSLVRVRPDLMYKGSVGRKHDCERAAMLDLTNPDTLPFVTSIFDEYIDSGTFPGEVIHIGTDEYYGDAESYRKFADAMLKHIRAKGKTPRLWGSLVAKKGQTPVTSEGVQMHIWSLDWQTPLEAIRDGYDIINILDAHTYVVPSGTGSVGAYGDDLNSHWNYDNWKPGLFNRGGTTIRVPDDDPRLLGGAWAMWNDNSFLTDPGLCGRDLMACIQKNCAVFAQKCWNLTNDRPYNAFLDQIKAQAKILNTGKPAAWSLEFDASAAKPVLADSDETTLYAVSPVNGKVGFRREGAQYTFDYTIPKDATVKLAFHSADRKTWITVDGKEVGGTPVRQYHPNACRYYTLPKPE